MTRDEVEQTIERWIADGTLDRLIDKYGISDEMVEQLDYSVAQWVIYLISREHGGSHKFADMCACWQAPGAVTDRELFAGVGTLADQYRGDERALARTIAAAKKNYGFTPNYTDFYNPSLAPSRSKRGHPDCFVPATGGLSHIRAVARKKGYRVLSGLSSDGMLRIDQGDPRPPARPEVKLGENIVRRKVKELVAKNPDLARKGHRELREMVIDKHGRKKASV